MAQTSRLGLITAILEQQLEQLLVDALQAVVNWVEKGKVPDELHTPTGRLRASSADTHRADVTKARVMSTSQAALNV